MTHRRNRGRGFTLMELMVVIIVLGFLMALLGTTWSILMRIHRTDAAVQRRVMVQAQVADQWRADVAEAVEAPDKLGDVAAGDRCVVLRQPDGKHIVYRWTGSALERTEKTETGEFRNQLSLGDETHAEFSSEAAGRLLTLRLLRNASREDRPKSIVEFKAALGGDVR